jgi:hypothetical protein
VTWRALLILFAASPARGATPAELLAEAARQTEALEYDRVISLAEQVLTHGDATVHDKLEGYLLQGSALAIVGRPVDAETAFRFFLRGRPDFDLPPSTAPKILAVFRKVQVEERAIIAQTRELELQSIVQSLRFTGEAPATVEGGSPVPFDYVVSDPRAVVAAVIVFYRRSDEAIYSALALQRDQHGHWRGALPGALTENDSGARLAYYVATRDAAGEPLVTVGSGAQPRTIEMSPGRSPGAITASPWFWIVVGSTALVITGAGIYGYRQSRRLPASDLGTVAF